MKKYILVCVLLIAFTKGRSQDLKQVVSAKITDHNTGLPLQDASVMLNNTNHSIVGKSDDNGNTTLLVPIGRYKLTISYTGYATVRRELLVVAGKEIFLSIALEPASTDLQEVTVEGLATEAALPGFRDLTIEKTLRIPANFLDPVRVATAYPAVVAANDQNNAIIIRGNSPNGLLWRLNGVDIVNPNHLANAGTLSDKPMTNGGGVNILSAQMLDRTNFYMGYFPVNYGNALSGIIDMNLRKGNHENLEFTAQASLIGMDISAEGPLKKNGRNSLLANYRYSTVGLLSQLGVDFGGESIGFQDFSFHVSTEQKNGAALSWFGFFGSSKNKFDARSPDEWEEDKDQYDIIYESDTYAIGTNYSGMLASGKIDFALAYSGADQERSSAISNLVSPVARFVLNDQYVSTNTILSANVRYSKALGSKNTWEFGLMTNYYNDALTSSNEVGCLSCMNQATIIQGAQEGVLLQPFTSIHASLTQIMQLDAGVRYLKNFWNNTDALDPRLVIEITPSKDNVITFAYSMVSQLQAPKLYFAEGNKDLTFTTAHHLNLGYATVIHNVDFKANVFYQGLYNVPIEADGNSTFSALNLLDENAPPNLVNKGTGKNYGTDVTFEKSFYGAHYFLVGGSYYESKYESGDAVERDTRFNGNYTLNAVYGKEWIKTSKRRTAGLNMRLLYLGGLRTSPINLTATQAEAKTVYDVTDPYREKLKDYFRMDFRISFRKDKPGYTRTFAIDIQNLLGTENEAYRYYDFLQQKVITKLQLGIIPVLVYRIDF